MPVADLDVHIVGLVRGVVVVASEGEVEVPFGSHADGTALDPREVQARIAFRVGVLGEFLHPVVPCALVDVQPFAEVVRFVRFIALMNFSNFLMCCWSVSSASSEASLGWCTANDMSRESGWNTSEYTTLSQDCGFVPPPRASATRRS